MKIFIYASVFLLFLIQSAPVSAAGFADTYGFGIRAISLGGAFSAVADDYSAAYYNPAGLSQNSGHHLSIEYFYTSPDIEVKNISGGDLIVRGPGGEVRTDPTKGSAGGGLDLQIPMIGVVLDINEIAKAPFNIQLGLAVSLPEQLDIAYRIHDYPPDQPHFFRYSDDIDRITLAAGLGIEVVKDLVHIGIGTQTMLYGPGKFIIDGLSLTEENAVAQEEMGAIWQYDPLAGILLTPFGKKLKIGFSWKDEQELKIGPLPVTALAFVGDAILEVPLVLDINAFFVPEEFSFGLALDLDRILVCLEADKQLWSKYEYSTTDSFNYAGSPDFDDTINYRLGVEYRFANTLAVSMGYCHQPSPVPDQSGKVSNYLDMDKDMLSLGLSYVFTDPWEIARQPVTIAGVIQYQMLQDLKVKKDGISGISWADQESYRVEGSVLSGGVSISLSW